MHTRPPFATRRLRRPLAVLAAVALATTMLGATSGAAAPSGPSADPAKVAAPTPDRVAAERALRQVERAFSGRGADGEVTLALRDLWRALPALSPAERSSARRYFSRPTDGAGSDPENPQYGSAPVGRVCGPNVCVHWVETGPHRVGGDDVDGNVGSTPAYVAQVLESVEHVAGVYLAAGYHPVRGDEGLGGDDRPDVYLADLYPMGAYGYCTSDQEEFDPPGTYDVWAYCALDNDYEDFGNTPLENIQVTAAHEYFHAVQFAYDYYEDRWLMEATATWAEDEVYDDVDDSVQYLDAGPLGRPDVPLDYVGEGHQYGDWIFFRYLTENVITTESGGLPVLVRDIWERADGSAAAAHGDEYSLQAVQNALEARGPSFGSTFLRFADANRRPWLTYEEGAVNDYPAAPDGRFRKSGKWYTTKLNHLTSASDYWEPQKGSKRLKVIVDLAPTSRGSWAMVSAYDKSGGEPRWWMIDLNRDGDGSKTVPFNKSISLVDVTLVNASTRVALDTCGGDSPYTCGGGSRDDRLVAKVRAVSLR
ncbi:MXAN_6640 family putative metalloprotease [Nocardioides ferulae]|uniref:MXAN_6640 family putative metalloprotease n=1 Tax=Nocardioides ferulae TaxID=2340821 RepID=UPI000EB5D664|nr:MXAN_6640 family putative metalloprotease [Nocardioides ferulae]